MLIDTHCHLNHKRLLSLGGPEAVIANARAAGVGGMLTICCRIRQEFDEILAIARAHDNVWCTVGTHPHDAGQLDEASISYEELVRLARSDPKIIGIGESGLDYFYKHSTPEDQQAQFRKHIRACIETGLPLVVHARDADEDIMRIIREEGTGTNLKGVMHCFSSGRAMGEAALDFGFFISFSGIVTFKKSEDLRDFARAVPLDRLLVETDAPYLAPEPDRGRINEPALVVHTARQVAELKRVSEENIISHTTNNFFDLFSRAKSA
jgi:TatD DNase family protein